VRIRGTSARARRHTGRGAILAATLFSILSLQVTTGWLGSSGCAKCRQSFWPIVAPHVLMALRPIKSHGKSQHPQDQRSATRVPTSQSFFCRAKLRTRGVANMLGRSVGMSSAENLLQAATCLSQQASRGAGRLLGFGLHLLGGGASKEQGVSTLIEFIFFAFSNIKLFLHRALSL